MVSQSQWSSDYSAVFCRETPDPGIHVDATWHKPSGQTPMRIKYTPPMALATRPPAGHHKHCTRGARGTWHKGYGLKIPQIQICSSHMGRASTIRIHGAPLAWEGVFCLKQYLGWFYGSKNIHSELNIVPLSVPLDSQSFHLSNIWNTQSDIPPNLSSWSLHLRSPIKELKQHIWNQQATNTFRLRRIRFRFFQ